jgi:hypothetical protein
MGDDGLSTMAVGGALVVFLVVRALVRILVVRAMARRLSRGRDPEAP